VTNFIAHRQEHGQTLAAVIHTRLHLSWSAAKELIAKRLVKVAGQTCADPARRILKGQPIDIGSLAHGTKKVPQTTASHLQPASLLVVPEGIIIRHSDEHLLVVEKPPGLTTMRHSDEAAEFGSRGKKFLPKTLADYLPALLNDGKPVIPVHRIDNETSGLLVFARTPEAAKHLGRQFRNHTIERTYLAIVRGQPTEGRIESWLVRDRGDGRRGSGAKEQGRRAVTHVRVIKPLGSLSLIECRLETGRTHQIRIHLGEAGCPLAGDRVYDRPMHGKPLPDSSAAKRVLLHATSLGFEHPGTGKQVRWESEMPREMSEIVNP
jgi:23S rRNA pseudouridine1911/1915/1917 synthase